MSKRRTSKKAKLNDDQDVTSNDHQQDDAAVNGDEVSEYERVRLENMRRNAEFLSTLGLDAVKPVAEVGQTKAPSKKGVTKRKPELQLPMRRSGRVTIERLKAEIETAEGAVKEEKQALLEEMMSKKSDGSYEATIAAEAPVKQRLDIPLSLGSSLNGPSDDADIKSWFRPLIDTLSDSDAAHVTSVVPSAVTADYSKRLSSLSVSEDDVAKLTESRIVAIWLHPSPHKVIAAAGDKEGNLGIWDVDHKGGPTEGIYKYQPHVGNICRLHSWYQNPSKLYSASYDGTIRFLDLEKEVLSLAFTAPEGLYEMAIVDAAFNDDGSTVYAGRNDGKVSLMDFRSKQSVNGYEWTFQAFENSRINSVQQHTTDPNLVVAAAGGQGGSVAIYDVRKASSSPSRDTKPLKPLHQLALHSKSINAAYISPNGQFIVSVSQDNTVRAWTDFATPGAKPQSGLLRHDNHTGRWLSTFRPAFDPKSETAFVLGSMDRPRKMEVFNPTRSGSGPASINLLANLKGDFLGSVCSRNCFHASMNIIAGGNSSGRVHILR